MLLRTNFEHNSFTVYTVSKLVFQNMKTLQLLFILCICSMSVSAQGIVFEDSDWKTALAKAKTEGKLMFVDSYTTWCGPCKKLSKNVFPNEKVGSFFNGNFISVKLDMEKKDGRSFGSKYPVSAYPTMFFINGDGKVVYKIKGYRKVEDLIKEGERAVGKYDRSEEYVEDYEGGKRDFDFMLNYVTELNRSKKESLKIANDYLRSKPDITEEQRVQFLFAATNEIDSGIFDQLEQKKDFIIDMKGEEVYEQKVLEAGTNTVYKAIEYDYYDLVDEAIEKVNNNVSKDKANAFKYKSNASYCRESGNFENYLDAMKAYSKKICKKDIDESKWAIKHMMSSFQGQTEHIALAEEVAKNLLKLEKNLENTALYAKILLQNGKKDEAIKVIEKDIEEIEKKGEESGPYKHILKRIQQSR